ncbi:hypothetical protein POM88_023794 [Heracleum sosnowskyi]|uniref:Pentatricopeptide repeat-containing protein n=1 Tax=Heracleum sosnowskyi TaxID=360622 RepID=A0AAD8MUZ7_9APIA|nr:hypothetical protein POM88_023794 [Heracleum sosnowskyi]
MINGLCKTGHTDIALWLFRFMEKCHCTPDSITYNTVIDSLCKGGLVDDALNVHSEVMEKRILPDVWTFSPIIQVLCSLKRWEEVGLLLNQMIYDMKISPDVHTFSILLDAYSKSGKLDDAKYIIQMMNERGEYPNIVTYNTLMQAYCSQGQMDGALAPFFTRFKIKAICEAVSHPCRDSLGRRRITSVTVEEAIPAKHKVTPVDINSEAKAGDADQEIGVLDAKWFDGDAEDHQL